MEFDDFTQDGQRRKERFDPSDNPADEPESNPDKTSAEGAENSPDDPAPESSFGGFESQEELLRAYQDVHGVLQQKTREAEELSQLLDNLRHHAGVAVKAHQDDTFLAHVREIYAQDPVHAMALMMRKSQEDALNDFDARPHGRLRQQQDLRGLLDDLFTQPSYSGLKPHENELAFLIREHGVPPQTAAQIIRNVQGNSDAASARRSDAAKAVRNRSMVESPGEVGEPIDKDKDFDTVLKKAKTLDQMFAGLRKLKL